MTILLILPFFHSYIETDGVGATVRPWFWIVALLVGPIVDYIFGSVYMFLSVRVLPSCRAICLLMISSHSPGC